MSQIVKVVRCHSNARASAYMAVNGLSFLKCIQPVRRRYDVFQASAIPTERTRMPLGEVFCCYGVWCFVPLRDRDSWYFGYNRAEAISGYLKAMGLERSSPASIGGAAE